MVSDARIGVCVTQVCVRKNLVSHGVDGAVGVDVVCPHQHSPSLWVEDSSSAWWVVVGGGGWWSVVVVVGDGGHGL